MTWVLAFSIQGEVEKYGAYLAIASFLGLALLSILYFAQAREVRRLREWAGRAPERDRELEERVSAQAEEARRVQAQPVPATAARAQHTVVAEPVAAAAPAALPQPVNGGAGPAAVPMGPRPATAAALVAAAVSSAAAVGSGEEEAAGSQPPGDVSNGEEPPAAAVPVAPAPPEEEARPAAPAATNGHGDQETGEQAVANAEVPAIPRATPRQAPGRPAAQPLRAPQRSATVPPRRTPPARSRPRTAPAPAPERSRPATAMLVLGGLAVLVIAVVALLATGVLGGGSSSPSRTATGSRSTSTSNSAAAKATPSASSPAARAATTVVILNGTSVNGLAATEQSKLQQSGYKNVQITTSQNQEQRSTVAYVSGERRQAVDVGRTLGVSAVQPLDPDTQSLANNSFAKPIQADVVVVVGADKSSG